VDTLVVEEEDQALIVVSQNTMVLVDQDLLSLDIDTNN
jgi:hypothetical protein